MSLYNNNTKLKKDCLALKSRNTEYIKQNLLRQVYLLYEEVFCAAEGLCRLFECVIIDFVLEI